MAGTGAGTLFLHLGEIRDERVRGEQEARLGRTLWELASTEIAGGQRLVETPNSSAVRFRQAEDLLGSLLAEAGVTRPLGVEALIAAHPDLQHELRSLVEQMAGVQDGFEDEAKSVVREQERLRRIVAQLADPSEFGQRYEIQDEIGRGGMGVVYRVYDRRLSRTLALKVIRDPAGIVSKGLAAAPRTRAWTRFLKEVRITARLDHPGIVPVHEVGVNPEGHVYFTMKLVKGRTLAEVLRMYRQAEGGWTLPRVLGVFRRMCEAVEFAHGQGVVHRDLKPSNIMVGDFGEVYVMDWGVARASPEEGRERLSLPDGTSDELSLDAVHTHEGELVGTPAYMSPEQARGESAEIGPWSDVYSIGAMLYELTSGSPPHVGAHERPSGVEVLRRVIEGPPRRLDGRSAPVELVAICEKALERSRDRRYADVGELAAEIERWLSGRSIRALATGPWNELGKWVGRNRALAAALAACVLVVIGGILFGWSKSRETYAARLETLAKEQALDEAKREATASRLSGIALVETWVSLLDEMNPIVQRDQPHSFAELLKRASTQVAGNESISPGMRGRLHLRIGKTLNALGEAASALESLQRAETLLREGGEPFARDHSEALLRLGHAEMDVGAIDGAESHLWQLLERSQVGLEEADASATCNALLSLAQHRTSSGRLDAASANLDAAYSLLASRDAPENDRDGLDSEFACIYHWRRADLQLRRGEFAPAEVSYLRSLEIFGKLEGSPLQFEAGIRLGLTNLYFESGRMVDARIEVETVLVLLRRLQPPPASLKAVALDQLGAIVSRNGDRRAAEELAREALGLRLTSMGPRSPATARSQVNLATLLIGTQCFDEAEQLITDASNTFHAVFGDRHPETVGAQMTLAWLCSEQGRDAEALGIYRTDLDGLTPKAGILPAREAVYRARLARVLVRAGHLEEARQQARAAFALAPGKGTHADILQPLMKELNLENDSGSPR